MPYKDRIIRLSYHKQYHKTHYADNKIQQGIKSKIRFYRYKELMFDLLGRECVKCGFSDTRALQLDHIEGNAKWDRRSLGGSFYSFYVKRPNLALQTFQVLCANCNWIKRVENDELNNHKRRR